jgi:hypothetical protein
MGAVKVGVIFDQLSCNPALAPPCLNSGTISTMISIRFNLGGMASHTAPAFQ